MASSATRRTLFTVLSRSLSSSSSSSSSFLLPSPISSRLRFAFPLLNRQVQITPNSFNLPIRCKASESESSLLNDPSPNSSKRPPKDSIPYDGCDYEHWLIVLDFPNDPKPSEEEMVNSYVKTLAAVVGSEEEAKEKIYSVCTTTYTGFGALISEELSRKMKELPGVRWVFPDSYQDVPNKDYGGDLFIDGKVIPRPQFRHNVTQQNNRSPSRYGRH
ncbi:multiple organellar RNA editing factor 3, mitochondrial-like [Cucumis sativus]|uniref:multiple organellar RNA editing factor 3, mitochondrial-like n=1 Tax=Cucumis sativus TaxID=3659 RepID=UPI0002B4D12B|nr:multiple organellar RNA editing factor 3, mitochondrial-like [Cucumis sativus]KAE8647096.1 hypothetical protein Csa_021713 [Cucumis sativus]